MRSFERNFTTPKFVIHLRFDTDSLGIANYLETSEQRVNQKYTHDISGGPGGLEEFLGFPWKPTLGCT